MSIEQNFARIADALERIAGLIESQIAAAPVEAPAAVPAAPAAPAAPTNALTAEDVNKTLVAEYSRLGANPEAQQKVFGVLKSAPFEVNGVNELRPDQYQAVVDAVKALV